MGDIVDHSYRKDQRRRVAQEAAELLYTEQEKEYKQAKLRAARDLNVHILPSNAEIAKELDRIAGDREGKARQRRLVQMRYEALQIMQILENFNPILVGSLWRGTVHRNSDIDIFTYAQDAQKIASALKEKKCAITKTEIHTVTKKGAKKQNLHVYLNLPSGNQVEIVIHTLEEFGNLGKCEIYGDTIRGLTTQQLLQLLKEDPEKRFVP